MSTCACLIPASSGKTLPRFATGFSRPNGSDPRIVTRRRSAHRSYAGCGSLITQLKPLRGREPLDESGPSEIT